MDDTSQWWSIALSVLGIAALVVVGRKNALGWIVALVAQAVWFAYAFATKQYGFLIGDFVYTAVYVVNFVKWRREERDARNEEITAP